MEAIIREASASDAGEIARLAEQLGYATTPEQAAQRMASVLSDDEHQVFVAEDTSGGIVGWAHVFGARRLVSDRFAEIGGLVVDEVRRGEGVGKALLARAEAWAMEGGYGAVRIRSNVVREGALGFYEHLGYRCQKQQNAFFKPLPQREQASPLELE
ncbi:MAG: GNAT family N-acetyltransferase [Anaerolineales bacterium]|jgi:GNAT superfamily N-acetyltransferase